MACAKTTRGSARGRSPAGWARARGLAAAALVTAALLAGCGGAAPGVAKVGSRAAPSGRPSGGESSGAAPSGSAALSPGGGSSSQEIEIAGTLALSRCMRANGVPDFPDPDSQGSIQFNTGAIDPNSPQFDRAQEECARYASGGQAPDAARSAGVLLRALRVARCMRSHGVPDFPEPSRGTLPNQPAGSGPAPPGLDANSPVFRRAMKICGARLSAGG